MWCIGIESKNNMNDECHFDYQLNIVFIFEDFYYYLCPTPTADVEATRRKKNTYGESM